MHATEQIHRAHSTTMILTEAGSSYFFRQNQRLQRFRLVDGREDFGLRLNDYNPQTLDKLITRGLVRKLEFPVHDVLQDRKELIRYVTTVTLGFFAHAAAYRLRAAMESSNLFRHTRNSESSGVTPDGRARREMTELLTRQILIHFQSNRDRPAEGRTVEPLIARFLAAVPDQAWTLLTQNRADPETRKLFNELSERIAQMVLQAELADYVALVWVELVAHLQHPPAGDTVPVVHLLSQLNGTGLNNESSRSGRSHRLHMMAATGDIQYTALKADLEEIAAHTGSGMKTYEQFYRSADTNQENLGLYYLGFLEDSCHRVGVGLRAFARGGRTDGNLNLVITI